MGLLRYEFVRGQTIDVPLEDDGAEEADAPLIISGIKPLQPGREDVDSGVTVIARPAVYYREATANVAKGWNLHLDATASAALPVGNYLLDAAIVEGVTITPFGSVILTIKEPAFQ